MELRKHGPVFLDIGGLTPIFPDDFLPTDVGSDGGAISETVKEMMDWKANVLRQLHGAGAEILYLELDKDKIFDKLKEVARSDEYRNRKEMGPKPEDPVDPDKPIAPDISLKAIDADLFKEMFAAYEAELKTYNEGRKHLGPTPEQLWEKESRGAVRGILTRGIAMNSETGPGIIEVMEKLSTGKHADEFSAREKFNEMFRTGEVPGTPLPKGQGYGSQNV